jgi:hypothetical protein
MLRLQGRGENLRQLTPVFDDQNPHYTEMLSGYVGPDPDFCVREDGWPCG